MSDGVLVTDAIAWEPVPGDWSPDEPPLLARVGEWTGTVWRSSGGLLSWRGKVRRSCVDERIICYRTEAAAKLATGERLRKAAAR